MRDGAEEGALLTSWAETAMRLRRAWPRSISVSMRLVEAGGAALGARAGDHDREVRAAVAALARDGVCLAGLSLRGEAKVTRADDCCDERPEDDFNTPAGGCSEALSAAADRARGS